MKQIKKMFGNKLNNKGNTLGVVVIGIILLGILGTLILNITAANYQMKIVDNQSKKNFYYVEKAVDEIYAGIGVEAMGAVSDAYQHVLTNMVSENITDGKLVTLSNDQADLEFSRKYFQNLKNKYMEDETTGLSLPIETTLDTLKSYIETVSDVTFELEKLTTTEIVYDVAQKEMRLKDIKVSSRTASGYYSSVTTDFVITLPDTELGFVDSDSIKWAELYKFALVVDGYETLQKKVDNGTVDSNTLLQITRQRLLNRDIASLTIQSGWSNLTTNVIGNIYVGTNSVSRKNSVDVASNSKFNVYAKNFICGGSVVLRNATANFNGINPTNMDIEDGVDLKEYGLIDGSPVGLRLWANNLTTEELLNNYAGIETKSELNVHGDCIIADDLEINGDNSKVRINGNYFGYGYTGSSSDEAVEADSSETTFFSAGTLLSNYIYEHEKRSAIIVNGKNADIILEPATSNDVVILGGRAYIDLETGSVTTGNATYMTGESVSFKGNQNLYKALTEDLGTNVTSNPLAYSYIVNNNYILGENLNYTTLGIDPTKVIAKRVDNNVYFYRYTRNPVNQTDYFLQKVNNSFIVKDSIISQISNLNVKNLKLGVGSNQYKNIFSVGAITQVDDNSLMNYQPIKGVSDGKLQSNFLNLVKEMKYRYGYISSELEGFEGIAYGNLSGMSDTPRNTTVYSNFVNETKLATICNGGRYSTQNVEQSANVPTDVAEEFCQRLFGKSIHDINFTVTMMDNAKSGGDILRTEHPFGVIVASGDVEITQDFTGIILCGGNLTISSGVTVTACPELIGFLATYDEGLGQLFGTGSSNISGNSVINVQNTDYQKLISYDNWRKN